MTERRTLPNKMPDFARLMALYEENYRQLTLLVDDHDLAEDRYISRVDGELPLYLEVLERHRYTTFARLTYVIDDGAGLRSLDPDAHIRIYHDAQVAEATHCYPGQINQPLFGALVPVNDVYEHRWRVNRFLDRWLEYLIQRGHGLNTLSVADEIDWVLSHVDGSDDDAPPAGRPDTAKRES
ncbi:MAG: DUF1249 domain-containing protein [Pseudomonadota bacterium]